MDIGNPNGTPIVFIHGFPLSHRMWTFQGGQTEPLLTTHRIILYDVRGHGESETGSGIYSIEFFVDDLISLLNHLNIQSAVIVGLSMGGYIALRAIERHPNRFRGLVLCNTKSEGDTNEAKIQRAAIITLLQKEGIRTFSEEYSKKLFSEHTFSTRPDLIKYSQSVMQRNSPVGISGTLLALAARTDTTAVLSKISVPTLVIAGEKDTVTPSAVMQEMQNKIPNSEFHIIPNAGHISSMENPKEFNTHLGNFLQKIK